MGWFRKVKKDEEKPRSRYSVTFWNKCDGSIVSKQLDVIPRVGEKVLTNDVFKGRCIFYEVMHVYHFLENDMIVIVLDEPP